MDVKEAARFAKDYISELFASEQITNVGLEEIEFDRRADMWKITVGFSRPWDGSGAASIILGQTHLRRSYKVILVEDKTSRVESVKDRILVDAK
jgi:hypothetical protein